MAQMNNSFEEKKSKTKKNSTKKIPTLNSNKKTKNNSDINSDHDNFVEDMLKNLSGKKVVEGYILHEILGKPKAFRNR
ncbi:MAG: hypothetical protein ABF289_05490 [Clostridiales bacterium]